MIKGFLERAARVGRSARTTIASDNPLEAKLTHLCKHGYVMFDHLVGTADFASLAADYRKRMETDLAFETPCLAQSRIDGDRDKVLIDNGFLATSAELEARKLTFSHNEAVNYEQVLSDFNPSTLKLQLPHDKRYLDLWLDPAVMEIAEVYLGFRPLLTEAYIRRNFPARFKVMNHHWHRDRNHATHLLKSFIFLSDCTLKTGPHHYISGSATDGKLNDKNYYTDAEIYAAYPPSEGREVVSEVKAGTIILEDTRGLHKAGVPDEGYRDLGFSVFLPPMMFKNWGQLYTVDKGTYNALSAAQRDYIPASNVIQVQ